MLTCGIICGVRSSDRHRQGGGGGGDGHSTPPPTASKSLQCMSKNCDLPFLLVCNQKTNKTKIHFLLLKDLFNILEFFLLVLSLNF